VTSSVRNEHQVWWAFARCVVVIFGILASAYVPLAAEAQTPGSTEPAPVAPERLRYVFDLPWCKAWEFRCVRCQKQDDEITCQRFREMVGRITCEENFLTFHCWRFNPPPRCTVWSDGCNICGRYRNCTAQACPQYRPNFICLRED
jgi:hypothetical protein